MMQTLKVEENVLLDEQCNFLTLRSLTSMNGLLVSHAFKCTSVHLCAAALAHFALSSFFTLHNLGQQLDVVTLLAQISVQCHIQKIFLLNLDYYILVPYAFNWILPIT